jgi:TatA/E family protein of Tat protein translocase
MFGFIPLFFNISGGEIFIILLIVFIVFGPAKIPEVARSLGRMMNEVKKASSDISREFRKEPQPLKGILRKLPVKCQREWTHLPKTHLKTQKSVYMTHRKTEYLMPT